MLYLCMVLRGRLRSGLLTGAAGGRVRCVIRHPPVLYNHQGGGGGGSCCTVGILPATYLCLVHPAGAPAAKEDGDDALPQEGVPAAQVGIRPCFYWISEASLAEAIESGEDSERTMTLAERSRWLATIAKGECQDAALVLPHFHGDPTAVFAGARAQEAGRAAASSSLGQLRCALSFAKLAWASQAYQGRAPGHAHGLTHTCGDSQAPVSLQVSKQWHQVCPTTPTPLAI